MSKGELIVGKELYGRIDTAEPNSSHAKMLNMCGENKRVIDFGCWKGAVSSELKTGWRADRRVRLRSGGYHKCA